MKVTPSLYKPFLFASFALFVTAASAQNLKVHYALTSDDVGSTSVIDVSGNGLDAALLNGAAVSTFNGVKVIDLKTSNGYVDMGRQLGTVILSLSNYSVMVKVFVPAASDITGDGNFVWSFANSNNIAADANGCQFFCAKNGRYAISPDNWTSESKIETGTAVAKGVWQTIMYVQENGVGRIFINGLLAKSGAIAMAPRELGATAFNYLGRSCYSADAYLKDAKLADFRIYDAPLSAVQVEQLSGNVPADYGVSIMARYEFDSQKDASGNYIGTLQNGATLATFGGRSVLSLGTADGYFNFGTNFGSIVSQLDSFSISTNMMIPAATDLSAAGNFVWTFAHSTDMATAANGNIFFSAPKTQYTISKTHWSGESSVLANQQLPQGRWINLTYTQRNGDARIYINGYLLAQSNISITPKQLGATAFNFLGRSCYNGDAYLKSALFDNFAIYKGRLSQSAIAKIAEQNGPLNDAIDLAALQDALKNLSIPGAGSIRSNISLISSLGNGISVTWETADARAVTAAGVIAQPEAGSAPVKVVLTATLHLNNVSVAKAIEVTILPKSSDAETIQLDLSKLAIAGKTDNLRDDILLPMTSETGLQVFWQSDSPAFLSGKGELVQLSPSGNGKKQVVLTATIFKGKEKASKSFIVWVAEDENRSAYLFVYFTGNDASGEQLRFAVSNDGYNYTPLNNGQPIISSDLISIKKGVRDPHILRGEDGNTFYMVATDMKSSEGWNSNRGMVLMKSTDLVNWSHATVNFPTKWPAQWGNVTRVWAPQTIYDPVAKKYMVYFSLKTSSASDLYDRVYYCYANDNFTDLVGEPRLLFDRGTATIDGDIARNDIDELYYMFFKNESLGGISQVTAKTLTEAAGQQPSSQWSTPTRPLQQTTEAVEGAGVFRMINKNSWVLMYDCYTNGHYQYCKSPDLKNFSFVQNNNTLSARHGTTISISDAEAARLAAKWPSTALSAKPLGARNLLIRSNGCVIDHTNKTIKITASYLADKASFAPMLFAAPGTIILPKATQNFSKGAVNYTFTINNTVLTYSVSLVVEADPFIASANIPLISGWNLISLPIEPDNSDVTAVFPNATEIKTLNTFFDKSIPPMFNTLTKIEGATGYFVFNTKTETISITGIKTQAYPLRIGTGWNLVGSPWTDTKTLNDALGNELNKMQEIKTFEGFWQNGGSLNKLNSIEPGKAYFIYK